MTYLNQRFRRHVLLPLYAILFAAGLVSLSACDLMGVPDLMGPSTDSGTARMQVLLVDNPFPFDLVDEVNVTISHVELRDGENTLTVMTESETFNLLALQNGVFAELGDIEIPAGTYTEARLAVEDATVLMKDGQSFDLKVPSGKVLVKLDGVTVEGGQDVSLTLDFDVSKSFVVQGNPNTPAGIKGFLLKPTVISKGMKENGRRGESDDDDGDDDGEDDGDDDDDGSDDDGSDDDGSDDDGSDDDGDDDDDGSDDDGGDDDGSGDDGGDDDGNDDGDDDDRDDQEVSGIVTAIETIDGSTFVTVAGLQIMIVSGETKFEGIADVDGLVVNETEVKVEYFEDSETGLLIATSLEVTA